jgi:hypothetical protein
MLFKKLRNNGADTPLAKATNNVLTTNEGSQK